MKLLRLSSDPFMTIYEYTSTVGDGQLLHTDPVLQMLVTRELDSPELSPNGR